MPNELSSVVWTAFSIGAQKLGQPVWLSNLVLDEYTGSWQPAQEKVPARCSLFSGLEKALSVPSFLSTVYCSGVNNFRHSASVWVTSNFSAATAAGVSPYRLAARIASPPAPAIKKTLLFISAYPPRNSLVYAIYVQAGYVDVSLIYN